MSNKDGDVTGCSRSDAHPTHDYLSWDGAECICPGVSPLDIPLDQPLTLGEYVKMFATLDPDAVGWGSTPDEFEEIEADCHPMSQRFVDFLGRNGIKARVVELELSSHLDPGFVGPYHAVAEVDGLWIDWTARQFHNVQGFRLEASEIPCPVIWPAGSPYPLPDIIVEETAHV